MAMVVLLVFALTPAENQIESDDGTVHLAWTGGEAEAYDVEHSHRGETVVIRSGTADFHLSGLREGEHRYRLREAGTERWSEPITVTVKFPSRTLVVSLLIVGGLLLIATAWAILRGPGEGP